MIRQINTDVIIDNIREMCIQANHQLSSDMEQSLKKAVQTERSEIGKKIFTQLEQNLQIA